MGQKASLHMSPLKGMDAAQGGENERRDWNKERYDRKEDSHGNINHYDWYRRKLNFEVVHGKIKSITSQRIPLHERIQNRLAELGFKGYKNGARNAPNVIMDFVIGGNRERMREMAFGNQVVNFDNSDEKNSAVVRQEEIENWALDTYRWAANRYGEENIIGFNVHLDETTPHIHMQVIPVAEMKKRGRVKAGKERETKMTVSFAGVVGENPKEYSAYKTLMHTDYFLQVGHKYGLERGTFFDDLTPEEQAKRRGHMTKAQYNAYIQAEKKLKELDDKISDRAKHLAGLNDEIKTAEKKLKSFTKMLSNLNDQKEHLEIEITALEEMRDTGNEEAEKQLKEKQQLLDEINEKIAFRTGQLNDVTEDLAKTRKELEKLDEVRFEAKQNIRKMAANATNAQDRINKRLKETEQLIKETDKGGMIERRDRYVEDRDGIIFAVWPEAKGALTAMVQRSSKPVNMFSKEQAESIDTALDKYPKGREAGAEALEKMSEREFNENHRVNNAWIPETLKEVKQIAKRTHPLIAALSQGRSNDDGSASYITDLTDWAGNQIKR